MRFRVPGMYYYYFLGALPAIRSNLMPKSAAGAGGFFYILKIQFPHVQSQDVKIFAQKVYNCGPQHCLSHPLRVHLLLAPDCQVLQFRIPSLRHYPFRALWSQRLHLQPHRPFGYSYPFQTL